MNLSEDNLKIQVAFFKGEKKSRMHRFIRWYTKSPYSHAELILPDNETWAGISPFLTSKVTTREKHLSDCPENWDVLTFSLSWRRPVRDYQLQQLHKFIENTRGSKYDWCGLIFSHLSSYLVKRRDRWYCSEWIAHALVNSRIIMWDDMKLYDTPDLSPGKLYHLLRQHSREYEVV